MTKRQAERITGLEIGTMKDPLGTGVFVSAWEETTEIYFALEANLSRALEQLVKANYQMRSEQVRRQQGYRCFATGRIVALSIDHIVARSKGRNDRRENLRGLSAEAHERRHQGEVLVPHPKVLESMAHYGWTWDESIPGWKPTEKSHVGR